MRDTHSIDQVREFHTSFGHPVASEPTVQSRELRRLRVALIAEELEELALALGVGISIELDEVEACEERDAYIDLVGAADALGDIKYVVDGAFLVFGLPAREISTEIHRSNMSKLGADGKPIYRVDGKVLKGPNYSGPKLVGLIFPHTIKTVTK